MLLLCPARRDSFRAASAVVAAFLVLVSVGLARAEAYDLAKAVERALKENFTITAAAHSMQAAENSRKAARGSFGPVLSTEYGYQKRQHKTLSGGREQDDDLYAWSVSLRQNVFAGFATLSTYQKSALEKENTAAGMARARLELIRTVQENFFLLLQARENVRSARDSLDRLVSQLQSTKAFYDVGLSPRLDVLQAEVDVATAENRLLQATNDYETKVARLNTLLVIDASTPATYTGSLENFPFAGALENCLATAYAKRPDLIMAQKSIEIADKDVSIARSGLFPQINAEGRWATQGDRPHVSGSTLDSTRFSNWTVGVTGEWQLWSWGSTRYTVEAAKQTKLRLQAEANNLRQEIAYEITSRLLDLDEAEKRIKVAQKGLEQAKEAYRMAVARYQSQAGIFLDVLDAQAKLTAAEVALTGAQADQLIALAYVYSAMGLENPDLFPPL